jgi:hypothetical protein
VNQIATNFVQRKAVSLRGTLRDVNALQPV